MLNGEYDQVSPLETSARVIYDLLETASEDKAFFLAEGRCLGPAR